MSTASAVSPALATPRRPTTNKWLVTVSVSFGTLMGAIDMSIVNVALPQIRGAVGATVQEITWITTGFVIATVVVMPLTAFLGRLFGQKRVYLASLAVFIAGSALCGTAGSLEALVFYRALQGLGAGALQPTEQAILRQTFPPKEQGMAMALFAMAVLIGPAVGPTLGGYIVDHYHWAWIFFINLPVGVLGFVLVWRFVEEPEDIRAANRAAAVQQRKNLDWQGIALLSAGLAALQYVLEEGQRNDWFESRLIASCAAVALLALGGFAWRELTAPVPAVNLRLFKDPVFTSGTLIGAVMFAMLMASMFLLPLFMQEMLGFTATQSGLALMPRVGFMLLTTPIVGRIYNRVSPRLLVGSGIALVSLGSFSMGRMTLETTSGGIILPLIVQGVGFGLLFVPLATVALSNIPRTRLADATGLNSLFRQIGGSMGLAVFATLLARYQVHARHALAAHVTPENPLAVLRLAGLQANLAARGGFDLASAKEAALAALNGQVGQQAAVLSFEKVFLASGLLFLCVLPLLLFLKANRNHGARPRVETEMTMAPHHGTHDDTARLHPVEEGVRAPAPVTPGGGPGTGRRRRLFKLGGAVLATSAFAFGAHLVLTRGDEFTDDAQVEADVVPIAPRVAGAVLRVVAQDNQLVKRGDLLFEIDPADFAARVRQAEAELATASAQAVAADAQATVVEASARGGFAGARAAVSSSTSALAGTDAQILASRATLDRAEAEARKASADLTRAKQLRAGDAIPQAQLESAQASADTADASVAAARAQVAAAEEAKRTAQSRVGEAQGRLGQSTPVNAQIAAARASADLSHARVKGAEAALELARLQLAYTRVAAPNDGKLSKVSVREGQQVGAAQPVAQLVPNHTYLVANFKETQIGGMKPGQKVDVEIDAYGGKKLEGTVESISGGTGARFSLLPPDNASGNFVKVVERVPVRIAWEHPPGEMALRAGLSANVTVHTRSQR